MYKDDTERAAECFLTLSHELRNALNIIMAACTMVERSIDERDKALDYLERIYIAGEGIVALIDDILEIRMMEEGKDVLNETAFSIEDLEKELMMLLYPLALDKDINLSVTSEKFFNREIIGDYGRLLQILINLATNSIKYTHGGGSVALCLEESENDDPNTVLCKFTCQDNGIGMSEEFIKHIYEPFTRERCGRAGDIKGTGLGMSIVKETIDAMGGFIHIDSKIDFGTTVVVQLKFRSVR